MSRLVRSWCVLLLPAYLPAATAIAGEVRVDSREALVNALRDATAGTTILVGPGTYRGGLSRANLRGTKETPIVIAAADATRRPVIEAGNGLHLSSPEYLVLRDLVVAKSVGNGINIDDSGSTDSPARHVLLQNITVVDTGPTGNRDGIKLSGVSNFRVERCRIERWGTGGSAIDMVGCRDGTISECHFVEGAVGANGVQMKGGSNRIVVERCRFQNAGGRGVNVGGSTGLDYFRPADAACEASAITVEDCEFIDGLSAIAFVGVDGAVARHNIIYRPRRWAVRILQENIDPRFVACRNGRFESNIVAFRTDEVREMVNISPGTAPETFSFSGNQWYCLDRPADTRRQVRLPVEESGGVYDQKPNFTDAERGDLSIDSRRETDPGVRRKQL